MEHEMTALAVTPLEMEVISGISEKTILSFHTTGGYFALTDAMESPEGDHAIYYEVSDATYENESLSLYFADDTKFQDKYDVVTLYWPMDEKIIDFLAGHLFLGTLLRLALHTDGRNRIQ